MDEGDLRGRRVLEVGCGTGLLAGALAERTAAKVWAVDAEPAMVEVARRRLAGARQARAEALPFKNGWFERVVLRLVVHLLDRDRALPELRRVLGPGGRAVIATFDLAHFEGFWLDRLFPRLREIDLARFPAPETLCGELETAGFSTTRIVHVPVAGHVSRDDALEKIRGRHISTFDLLTEDEVADGTARAARELPERVEIRQDWALVVADA